MHMNLAARALERVGDNAVDIAEQVGFLLTGEFREFTDASHEVDAEARWLTSPTASWWSRTKSPWPTRSATTWSARGTPSRWPSDGRQALDRFQAETPALVILDLMLPEMSGLDVCRPIRAESTCRSSS